MIWSKQTGEGKPYKRGNDKLVPKSINLCPNCVPAGDQAGYCGMDVDKMEIKGTLAYDKDFFDRTVTLATLYGISVEGSIKLNGEVGLKVGWGYMDKSRAMVGPHIHEPRCHAGNMVYAIPYAQATLTGEVKVSVLVAKVGGGVEAVLIKFSLPSTSEWLSDGSQCDGVGLSVDPLGGKV